MLDKTVGQSSTSTNTEEGPAMKRTTTKANTLRRKLLASGDGALVALGRTLTDYQLCMLKSVFDKVERESN